jgi:hypothetical protein
MRQPQVCKHQVCDHCGGRFGMVTHRWWGNKFCKRTCKDAYLCVPKTSPVLIWCQNRLTLATMVALIFFCAANPPTIATEGPRTTARPGANMDAVCPFAAAPQVDGEG